MYEPYFVDNKHFSCSVKYGKIFLNLFRSPQQKNIS